MQKENMIELRQKKIPLLLIVLFYWSMAIIFVGLLGIYLPYMGWTDPSSEGAFELNSYVIGIALFGWTIGYFLCWLGFRTYNSFKRIIIFDSEGVHNLPSIWRASKTKTIPWESIIKIESKLSNNYGWRIGPPIMMFYTLAEGKEVPLCTGMGPFGYEKTQT